MNSKAIEVAAALRCPGMRGMRVGRKILRLARRHWNTRWGQSSSAVVGLGTHGFKELRNARVGVLAAVRAEISAGWCVGGS